MPQETLEHWAIALASSVGVHGIKWAGHWGEDGGVGLVELE